MSQHVVLCGQHNINVIGNESLVSSLYHLRPVLAGQLLRVLVVPRRNVVSIRPIGRIMVHAFFLFRARSEIVAVEQIEVLTEPSSFLLVDFELVFLILQLTAVVEIDWIHIEDSQNAEQENT